jgi:RNA 3'-terminal phosphate cyclase (ATP)
MAPKNNSKHQANEQLSRPTPKGVRQLDGSTGEGGGQLLRMAVCLAAITNKDHVIRKIRWNRGGGTGLKRQHLSAVNWLAAVSGADVEGNAVKSPRLDFLPGRVSVLPILQWLVVVTLDRLDQG